MAALFLLRLERSPTAKALVSVDSILFEILEKHIHCVNEFLPRFELAAGAHLMLELTAHKNKPPLEHLRVRRTAPHAASGKPYFRCPNLVLSRCGFIRGIEINASFRKGVFPAFDQHKPPVFFLYAPHSEHGYRCGLTA